MSSCYPCLDPATHGCGLYDRVMPLSHFSDEKNAEIAEAVAQPKPPDKWLDLGVVQIHSRAWWEWHWQRGVHPEKRRPKLSPYLRRQVIDRDGYRCGLCGGDVEPTDVHIDHIKPHSLGGPDTLSNLQVSHSTCNIRKGARV